MDGTTLAVVSTRRDKAASASLHVRGDINWTDTTRTIACDSCGVNGVFIKRRHFAAVRTTAVSAVVAAARQKAAMLHEKKNAGRDEKKEKSGLRKCGSELKATLLLRFVRVWRRNGRRVSEENVVTCQNKLKVETTLRLELRNETHIF